MDNTKKFDGLAGDYTFGRPSYAPELTECLYTRYGFSDNSVIADIGSGTGKFAALLLEKGSTVCCVEPNADMRHAAEKLLSKYPKFRSVDGDAENTSLSDCFADRVTTAQAFHWFDTEKFRAECQRILKPDGYAVLIWNVRDIEDPVNAELYQIFSKYCPDFKGFSGGIKKNDSRIVQFFRGEYDYAAFDAPLLFNKEKFTARCLSGSYSLKDGDENFADYISEITALFEKYARNGLLTAANQSTAYIGKVK